MAVPPQTLERNLVEESKIFESKIDEYLLKHKIVKGQCLLVITAPAGMKYVHFSYIKKVYESAGWAEVTWNSNQKHGDWLSFKY